MNDAVTVVVFTVPEKRLREIDVASGPCVPTEGRNRPLVTPIRQDRGEYPRHTAALYTVLTGRPWEHALELVTQQGPGFLYACTSPFVEAMADASLLLERLAAEDDARDDGDWPSLFAQQEAWSRDWRRVGGWPRDVKTTSHRLGRMGWAWKARERAQPLYVWHGPAVETYTAVSADPADDSG